MPDEQSGQIAVSGQQTFIPRNQVQPEQASGGTDLGSLALGMLVGAAAGYGLRGANEKVVEAPDPVGDALTIANLQERVTLMEARNEALNALNVALKDQSTTGLAVVSELQATITMLNNKLSAATVGTLVGFPVIIGPGDPTIGGYIKGRDGMLISRILSNFLPPTGTQLSLGPYDMVQPTTGFFSVSDPTRKLAPKAITIGRAVNNAVAVSMRNGIFPGMAIILNFAEDVADDSDFIALGTMHSGAYYFSVNVMPLGRKSLMLVAGSALTLPASYSVNQWQSNLHRDTSVSNVSNPTVAQRTSYTGATHCVMKLGHRAARSLSLLSWNIVANPLAQYAGSYSAIATDVAAVETTLTGPATVVRRLNTGALPKFYLPDEVGEYNAVDLSSASYM